MVQNSLSKGTLGQLNAAMTTGPDPEVSTSVLLDLSNVAIKLKY